MDHYRQQRKGNFGAKLTAKQVAQLDEIGFVWQVRRGYIPFGERVKELRKYKETYGDFLVPKDYVEQDKLGSFAGKMRMQYHGKRAPPLTPEQIEQLCVAGLMGEWKRCCSTVLGSRTIVLSLLW